MKNATVEVISSDLSHQETILQIADALDQLDQITESVFNNIKNKVDENSRRLDAIDSRVDLAGQKVQALSEMNKKATSIFSSAKYPSSNDYVDYKSAFAEVKFEAAVVKEQNSDVKLKLPEKNLKGLDAKDINEKNRYLHIAPKKRLPTKQRLEENPNYRQPFQDTRSALSYLIFNTAENPFHRDHLRGDFVNPLDQQQKSNKAKDGDDELDGDALGEAPASLFGPQADEQEDFFFAPALGDLPELDLPDILDLPNLPTNLAYATDLGPGIAPSVNMIPSLEDQIPDEAAAMLSEAPPPPPPDAVPPPPLDLPPPTSVIAAPPPVPAEVPIMQPPELPPAPPVLPPPVAALPEVAPVPEEAPVRDHQGDAPDAAPVPAVADVADGGRSSLMAAIRSAGGASKANLKSVKERKLEEKKAKQEQQEQGKVPKASGGGGGGGDLMSDLASKLAMRRMGISGRQENASNGPPPGAQPTAMDKISMMIPPPPVAGAQDEDDGDNEDSDDDWS